MVWRLCQSDNNLSSERTEARNKPVQGWRGWFGGENGEGCEDRCPRREKIIVWERRWRDSRRKRKVDEDHSSRGLWRGKEKKQQARPKPAKCDALRRRHRRESAIKLWLDLMPFRNCPYCPCVPWIRSTRSPSPRKQGRWGQREAQGTTPGIGQFSRAQDSLVVFHTFQIFLIARRVFRRGFSSANGDAGRRPPGCSLPPYFSARSPKPQLPISDERTDMARVAGCGGRSARSQALCSEKK